MWLYNNQPFSLPENFNPAKPEWQGFVYVITNKLDGRKYIGKKFFVSIGYYQKNKKRKRRKEISDWQAYYGSGPSILADIEKLGKENFTREIIHLCKTKSECGYLEAYEQFVTNAIIRDDYYNDWVSCKVQRRHLAKHKDTLMESINESKRLNNPPVQP